MSKNAWILIPAPPEGGPVAAVAPDHVQRVSLGHRESAVGLETGKLRLELHLVGGSVQTIKGSEAIRDVLGQLGIEGLRPRPKENEETAA